MDDFSRLYDAIDAIQEMIDWYDAMSPQEQVRVMARARQFVRSYHEQAHVSIGSDDNRFVVLYDWDDPPASDGV